MLGAHGPKCANCNFSHGINLKDGDELGTLLFIDKGHLLLFYYIILIYRKRLPHVPGSLVQVTYTRDPGLIFIYFDR